MKNIVSKTLLFAFLLSVCLTNAGKVIAQVGPLNSEAYLKLGYTHAEAGRWQEAIKAQDPRPS